MSIKDLIAAAEVDPQRNAVPPAYDSAENDGFDPTGNAEFDAIVKACQAVLMECIREKGWEKCFTQEEVVAKARRGPGLVRLLMTQWKNFPRAYAIDMVVTMLAEWVLFYDDSASMPTDERRLEQLVEVGKRLALMGGYCDENGYQVRALSTDLSRVKRAGDVAPLQDKCKHENDFITLYESTNFTHATPLGSKTEEKIHQPMIRDKIVAGEFDTPVSVWYLTDGEPYPEKEEVMFRTCAETYQQLRRTKWGIGGLLNMMVLVGPVKKAVQFALRLDNDERWNASFDMILPLEEWIAMMSARHPDTKFGFYEWLTKTFVGHFLKKWDVQDPSDAEIEQFFNASA